jgi:metal-responsive CopG/Arc/MetJ family transcriptional regulator
MSRVTINMPENLLKKVDGIANEDYTSRSNIIRQAVLFYIRSNASALSKEDVDSLFRNMKSRQLRTHLNKALRNAL